MDVDYFKVVNDSLGHNVGDLTLVNIVKVIKGNLRKTDMLARWGGEEFLIVMHDTGLDGAIVVAEKIRKQIEQTLYPKVGHLTCSFGVVSFKRGEQIKDMIERADKALYTAKRNGRNQVVSL